MEGYNFSQTKNNITQNEGTVVYYKKNNHITVEEPPISECNCIMLRINNSITVLAIYRPADYKNPNDFLQSLNVFLLTISKHPNIALVGDINIDISRKTSDPNYSIYLNLLASHGMLPAHAIPTHNKTCLDHVILTSFFTAFCYVSETSITDHDSLILTFDQKSPLHVIHKIRKRIDYSTFFFFFF